MINILKKHPNLIQFIKFSIVGVSGAIVDFGLYSLFTRVFDLKEIPATSISVFLAIINNFYWNKYWTFKKGQSGRGYGESVKFFIVSAINYFANLGIFALIIYKTPAEQIFGSYEDFFAKVVAIGLVMISNYFGNKYWTFR